MFVIIHKVVGHTRNARTQESELDRSHVYIHNGDHVSDTNKEHRPGNRVNCALCYKQHIAVYQLQQMYPANARC